MATEWSYVARLLAPILKRLPRWILRTLYPSAKLNERIDVLACGIGPHLYVNPDRPPAVCGLVLRAFNRLPFPVTLDWLHLEFAVESRRLIEVDQRVGRLFAHYSADEIRCHEIPLSDGQMRMLREIRIDGPVLQITGRAHCQSAAGDFDKAISVQIRAFIYRGSEAR